MTAPIDTESAETKPTGKASPEDEQPSGAFNPNDYDWPAHLKRAIEDLKVKKVLIDRDWRYYDGDHPKVWLTDAIRDRLDDELVTNMAENWCDVAVDAAVKRQFVTGFMVKADKVEGTSDTIVNEAAQNVWDDNDLKLEQRDIYTSARCTGESFLFAWKDEEKDTGIDTTVVDARNVWWPPDAHRNNPTRVVKVWADEDDGVWRATMYYKYVVVRLVGPKLKDGGMSVMPQARYFTPDADDPGGEHGFEQVPVIRFALHKKRRSLIDRIRTIQDKINKLAANLLVSAEFNAWRKMIALTEQTIEDDTLKFRPNRVPVLDPGGGADAAPTSIWEGAATELSNYSDEQDKLIDKLFTKADLPGHLKVKAEKVAPSGAAYEADEGPFTEAIEDMNLAYGESWHDFYALVLGIDVEAQWRNPHVKSDKDEGDTVKVFKDAGVPVRLALKHYAGWTEDMLKELDEAPLSPQEQLAVAATQALAEGESDNASSAQGNPGKPPLPSNSGGSGQPAIGAGNRPTS